MLKVVRHLLRLAVNFTGFLNLRGRRIHRRRAAQREVFELFGTIEYYDDYDYKRHR